MFLTKKNAHLVNKGKAAPKKRPLGGWEDDQDKPATKQANNNPIYIPKQQTNLLEDTDEPTITKQPHQQQQSIRKVSHEQNLVYYDWGTLNERTDIDCQKYLIEKIVQPGGIRIKPSDSMLLDMLKEVKGMEISNIGSLLLSKLEVNYPFQVKAKALYTIEYLAKKDKEYQFYFREHAEKIKEFPEPEDNVESYKKIQKSVLNQIGTKVEIQASLEQAKPEFVDPGYYQEPPKSQMSSFLDKNVKKVKKTTTKKPIIGPGQAKNKTIEKKKSITSTEQEADLVVATEPVQNTSNQTGLQGLLDLKPSTETVPEANNDLLV